MSYSGDAATSPSQGMRQFANPVGSLDSQHVPVLTLSHCFCVHPHSSSYSLGLPFLLARVFPPLMALFNQNALQGHLPRQPW